MRSYHWLTLVIVLAVGYVAGIKFPGLGNRFGL